MPRQVDAAIETARRSRPPRLLLPDPAAQQRMAQSQEEIERGEGLTLDQVEEALAERFRKR